MRRIDHKRVVDGDKLELGETYVWDDGPLWMVVGRCEQHFLILQVGAGGRYTFRLPAAGRDFIVKEWL